VKKSEVKILLVDDEEDILEFIGYNLSGVGYQVKTAKSGKKALKLAKKFEPHIIILDVMMPEMDGIEVCTTLREQKKYDDTIITFLTARNDSFTHITALESGGDDYINKPIKPNLLKSRIKALARRHPAFRKSGEKALQKEVFGDLVIDHEGFTVKVKNKKISLVKKEFHLLRLLTSKPDKVFKRAEILNKVWGQDVIVGDRTIDVHIRKLREKIGKKYIETMKGVGYKFKY